MWNHKQIGLFRLFSSPFSFHVILLNYQETITVIWIRPVVSKTNLSVYNFNGFLPPSLAPREVCCLELFKFGLGVKRSSQPSVKPPITTAALSHSLLMFGPRPVRLLWQQEGGSMFFCFFLIQFQIKAVSFELHWMCDLQPGRGINHASYSFPCCVWSGINTLAHTGKLNVIQIVGSLSVWWRKVSLLSSWTTRLSLSPRVSRLPPS